MENGADVATVQEAGSLVIRSEPRGSVTVDADDTAIAKIGRILAPLDTASRTRVLTYLKSKYNL